MRMSIDQPTPSEPIHVYCTVCMAPVGMVLIQDDTIGQAMQVLSIHIERGHDPTENPYTAEYPAWMGGMDEGK